jgi:hypothetical protein
MLGRSSKATVEQCLCGSQAQLLVLVGQQLGHDLDAFRAVSARQFRDVDERWGPSAWISADTFTPRP